MSNQKTKRARDKVFFPAEYYRYFRGYTWREIDEHFKHKIGRSTVGYIRDHKPLASCWYDKHRRNVASVLSIPEDHLPYACDLTPMERWSLKSWCRRAQQSIGRPSDNFSEISVLPRLHATRNSASNDAHSQLPSAHPIDLKLQAQIFMERRSSIDEVHKTAVELYHGQRRTLDALKFGIHILGAAEKSVHWDWNDRCLLVGEVIHFARRANESEQLYRIIQQYVLPLVRELKAREKHFWPKWLVYLAGQMLDLHGDYSANTSESAESELISTFVKKLYAELKTKYFDDNFPLDYNLVCHTISSHALALSRSDTEMSRDALQMANEVKYAAQSENHQVACNLKALERGLVLHKRSDIEELSTRLELRLDRACKADIRPDPNGIGYRISPVTFNASCLHLVLAARAIDHRQECRITEKITDWSNKFFVGNTNLAAGPARTKIHLSPALRKFNRDQPVPSVVINSVRRTSSEDFRIAAAARSAMTLILKKTQPA